MQVVGNVLVFGKISSAATLLYLITGSVEHLLQSVISSFYNYYVINV